MAGFQSNVRRFQTDGLPGEAAQDGPERGQVYNLDSSGTPQTFGNVFTQSADNVAEVGGTGAYLGILVRPKDHALIGDGTTALGAVNALPDNATGTISGMGIYFVTLTEAGNVGDPLNWVEATGAIGVGAPGAGEQAIPGAKIIRENVSGAGTAIISLTD